MRLSPGVVAVLVALFFSSAVLSQAKTKHHKKKEFAPILAGLTRIVDEVYTGLDEIYDSAVEGKSPGKAVAAVKLRLSKAWVIAHKLEEKGGKRLLAAAAPLLDALREAAEEMNSMVDDAKDVPRMSKEVHALLESQERHQQEQVLELIRRAEMLTAENEELNQLITFMHMSSNKTQRVQLPPAEEPPPVVAGLLQLQKQLMGDPAAPPAQPMPPAAGAPGAPLDAGMAAGPSLRPAGQGQQQQQPPAGAMPMPMPMPGQAPPMHQQQQPHNKYPGMPPPEDEGVDFVKMGHFLANTPVLTTAARDLAEKTHHIKQHEVSIADAVKISEQQADSALDQMNNQMQITKEKLKRAAPEVAEHIARADAMAQVQASVPGGGAP